MFKENKAKIAHAEPTSKATLQHSAADVTP